MRVSFFESPLSVAGLSNVAMKLFNLFDIRSPLRVIVHCQGRN